MRKLVLTLVTGALAATLVVTALGVTSKSSVSVSDTPTQSLTCTAAVFHPIDISIKALDTVEPGAQVRVQVISTASMPLENAVLNIVDAGPAEVFGARSIPIGSIGPETRRTSEFTVRLPQDGTRSLVQVRVSGEGREGSLSRGATLNLLPNGPQSPRRIVQGSNGRLVAEYEARRIN